MKKVKMKRKDNGKNMKKDVKQTMIENLQPRSS